MASTLPDNLMLEIIVRSDVASIVRCAATCKSLRGRILESKCRRRHRALNASLLRGVSYRIRMDRNTFEGVLQTTSSSSPLRFNASLFESFKLIYSLA
ncbi:hypothetical protein E2562_033051 [Oryza meyeriana var. granulata]|uniref:F-box domain-containing protein n=1 Tax=Oryza meyeriana var. granulata TaxID=110450 RepID=A0A6G1DR31_9ORYZ|nr:hypothetical protein E2562_033051 [Oryza meyeriana var. granulata]